MAFSSPFWNGNPQGMEPLPREPYLMELAFLVSRRATCARAQVGAIITLEGRVISTGYNGPPSGEPHCGNLVCDITKNCQRSVHAEANAIVFAAKYGIPTKGTSLYVTHLPCYQCSQLIVNSGIVEVVYYQEYNVGDNRGFQLLTARGITIRRYNGDYTHFAHDDKSNAHPSDFGTGEGKGTATSSDSGGEELV